MLTDPNTILESYDLDILALTKIGTIFAEHTKNGDLVLLSGKVGAGKTEFARQIIKAKAIKENLDIEEISSPTFSLIQTYDFKCCKISHVDLYRVNSEEELFELGIPDIFDNQITLLEWPEILEIKNFARNINLEIRETRETRVIKIKFFGNGWSDLIVSLLGSGHFSDEKIQNLKTWT